VTAPASCTAGSIFGRKPLPLRGRLHGRRRELDNLGFQRHVADAIREVLPGDMPGSGALTRRVADSGVIWTDWKDTLRGQDPFAACPSGRPDLQGRAAGLLSALGPRVAEIRQRYADRYGWTPKPATRVWKQPGFGRGPPKTARPALKLTERADRPIADEYGAVARPLRAIDILAAMQRRGAISAKMRQAGEDFRAMFRRAGLDPLKAANLLQTGAGQADDVPFRMLAAREHIWRALNAV
jgi:hypothetical protein